MSGDGESSRATGDGTVATTGAQGPSLVVIGLPRSGSSYLAHVLSSLDDLWVFDDLYALQKAEPLTLGPLDDRRLAHFLDRLAWETRARVRWERDFAVPAVDESGVDRMEIDAFDRFRGRRPSWHEVTAHWGAALAAAAGAGHWGYKTPQDFLHVDYLRSVWPDVRFVHLVRDPRDVLASYKNLTARRGGDGDPRQYHPIATAWYWRSAQRAVAAARDHHHEVVHTVRFEDLVADPGATAERLATALDTTVRGSVTSRGRNSSHAGGPRRRLTDTEVWICERIAGTEMEASGYALRGARPRLRDLPEIVRVTTGFVVFQVQRTITDPEKRGSVRRVLGGHRRSAGG